MKIPNPILKPMDSLPSYFYLFLGTADRRLGRNEWMFVKVGVANNVHRRLRSYQTHCPVPFHTGLRVLLPNAEHARRMETAFLKDDELKGYRSQGEWFVVFAGPDQHVLFIKELLARFYIERLRNEALWKSRLEWVIWPYQKRVTDIPDADMEFFCGAEIGEKSLYEDGSDGTELNRRVKAEAQAQALGHLIYPELDSK